MDWPVKNHINVVTLYDSALLNCPLQISQMNLCLDYHLLHTAKRTVMFYLSMFEEPVVMEIMNSDSQH